MPFFCSDFHQSVFTVLSVEREGLPHDQRSTACSKKKTDIGTGSGHIQYHDQDKYSKQSACENEKVLRLEPPELDCPSNTFVDVVRIHSAGLKEEGAQYGSRYNKEDTGSEPACRGF